MIGSVLQLQPIRMIALEVEIRTTVLVDGD